MEPKLVTTTSLSLGLEPLSILMLHFAKVVKQNKRMDKNSQDSDKEFESNTPPEGCQHYVDLSDVPWDIQKYVPSASYSKPLLM